MSRRPWILGLMLGAALTGAASLRDATPWPRRAGRRSPWASASFAPAHHPRAGLVAARGGAGGQPRGAANGAVLFVYPDHRVPWWRYRFRFRAGLSTNRWKGRVVQHGVEPHPHRGHPERSHEEIDAALDFLAAEVT